MDNEQIQKCVIEKMKLIRISKGISQMDVCLKSNMSQSFYANIESGKKSPSLLTVIRIASALDVNPRDFFPEIGSKTKDEIKNEICSLVQTL